MGMLHWIRKLAEYWEAAQVELHGCYSIERVRELIDYNRRTTIFRALLVLVLMPWPCVIITILVDLIPLRPSTEGLDANHLFILRVFLAFWVASIVVNLQFRHSVPAVTLSNIRVIVNSAFTAVFTTSVSFGVASAIGFPVPFGIIAVSPAWVLFLLVPLASFLQRARADPELWTLVINSLKVWVCQESLVVIYPTYFYIFTTLPDSAKSYFAFLLPVIKMILRNVMSRTVVHLNDEIPEVVLMNVEVFNSLFMSYCMQNTPSVWTTLGLIAIDGVQMMASMRDVTLVIQRMQIVEERVNVERAWLMPNNRIATQLMGMHRKSILVYTDDILERYKSTFSTQIALSSARTTGSPSSEVVPLDTTAKPKGSSKQTLYSPRVLERPSLRKVYSAGESNGVRDREDMMQLELEYTMKVRKVLYITEFMVLINYVEVIVPIIFSANLLVMYRLPNRVYYSQIVSMDDAKLWNTLENVMLYCFLQLVSLVVLFLVLRQKLRISGLRQLAFVLEKQAEQIQTKLVLWVFYNVQATLDHFGEFRETCLASNPVSDGSATAGCSCFSIRLHVQVRVAANITEKSIILAKQTNF